MRHNLGICGVVALGVDKGPRPAHGRAATRSARGARAGRAVAAPKAHPIRRHVHARHRGGGALPHDLQAHLNVAAEAGARLVCFPELAHLPFFPQDPEGSVPLDWAEPVPGPVSYELVDQDKQALLAIARTTLETFLHQTLGLGWEAVHEEAEKLEHHLSERLVESIDRHLNHPRRDPHGEPIPDASGHMSEPGGFALTTLAPDTAFRIVRVDPSTNHMLEYLDSLGIGLGISGVVVEHAPFDGPVTLRLSKTEGLRETVIGREVAGCIYAETR